MHFYMRNARLEEIKKFQREHGIKSLGMPYMVGNGSADINNIKHRFIVLPRYGTDVAKLFLANGRRLPEGTCYRLALQMLDVYQFIHCCGYVHADLKASNILLGYDKQHQAYLVDFGLASHFTTKDFKPDPKKMHNGTIEYTSRDAHLGVATMRADLEILGYNLIEWLGADLPWVKDKLLTTPIKVQKAKEAFMSDVEKSLKKIFTKEVPLVIKEYFKYVAKMDFNETPNYEKCRKMFTAALKALKLPLTGDLDFNIKASASLNKNTKSPLVNKYAKMATKKNIKNEISSSENEDDSEDEIINASDDDVGDVISANHKNTKKNKKSIKPASFKQANPALKRTKNDSLLSESSPSPSKRSKPNPVKSPSREKMSPLKQKSTLKTASSNSPTSKLRHTPLNAKANIRMSPAVTLSSSRSGKTVINDRITPNKKPSKTYEFNFELDVSMDANVIVNVKRKKKLLEPSQELQNTSSRNTPSVKPSTSTSNSTPVTRVKVRKVGNEEDISGSPRTPAVTVKKSRRVQ